MGYRIARLAQRDLDRAFADGVRKFGIARAESYYLGLLETFDLITEEPGMGVRRLARGKPVRILPHGSHVIIYRATAEGVEILRLRHERENWLSQIL
jgi:toxin ParE1/3/4